MFLSHTERNLARRRAERWVFLREAMHDLGVAGALAPSGRALAKALAAPLLPQSQQPRAVLEVGAGTGTVSRYLIRALGPNDTLHLVECNPRFAAHLRRILSADPRLRPYARRVRVLEQPVERLSAYQHYDIIVSGLPFANLTPDQVTAILSVYWAALKPGGELTYLAYRGTHAVRHAFATPPVVARYEAVREVLEAAHVRCGARARTVWRNLPPARVYRLRAPEHEIPGGDGRAVVS